MEDLRFELGLYSLPEAARLASIPSRTLTNWVRDALSFVNLMEALALAATTSRSVAPGAPLR